MRCGFTRADVRSICPGAAFDRGRSGSRVRLPRRIVLRPRSAAMAQFHCGASRCSSGSVWQLARRR
eukprot:9377216-Lingulodinium_polyedra.AAC.1